MTKKEAIALLRRAADSLQAYCENENGDMNDSLAMEIYDKVNRWEVEE